MRALQVSFNVNTYTSAISQIILIVRANIVKVQIIFKKIIEFAFSFGPRFAQAYNVKCFKKLFNAYIICMSK